MHATDKNTTWEDPWGSGVLKHVTVGNNVVVRTDAFLITRPELKTNTTVMCSWM
jgi:hypothetical protein